MPPHAASNAPGRAVWAPVKAPFSWPKRCASMSVAGMAPQSTTTNGPSLRGDSRWMASASRPLPVPVSPSIRIVEPDAAMRGSSAKMRRMAAEAPTMLPNRS